MKKSELVNIIKKAVREEVTSVLQELLLNENNSSKKTNIKVQQKVESVNKNAPTFSKNSKLNEALLATRGGIPQEGGLVSGGEQPRHTDFNGNEVQVEQLPDSVSRALTRDYSELLQIVDKKKKQGTR